MYFASLCVFGSVLLVCALVIEVLLFTSVCIQSFCVCYRCFVSVVAILCLLSMFCLCCHDFITVINVFVSVFEI